MYADALIILKDTTPQLSADLLETVSDIFDQAVTVEDRFGKLCNLLPERHHGELRRVVLTHRTPRKMANFIANRGG